VHLPYLTYYHLQAVFMLISKASFAWIGSFLGNIAWIRFAPPNRGVKRGAKGEQFPGRRITMGAPSNCGGRSLVPTISQVVPSIQFICFRNTSGSNMGRQTSCTGRHLTSLRSCCPMKETGVRKCDNITTLSKFLFVTS